MRKATTPMETLAASNLKRIFEAKKYGPERLTQQKLADLMGFNQQTTVSQYLSGRNTLGVEAIAKFASVLGVSPEEIRPDFFELLHIKQPPRNLAILSVRESLSGEAPAVRTLRTTIAMQTNASTHYAVFVDSDRYRQARIRPRSHIVVAEGLEPLVDDDVYIVTMDGTKHLATLINQDEQQVHAISLADGTPLVVPLSDVQVCDVIVGVEHPRRPS